jgi:hypothetical protein
MPANAGLSVTPGLGAGLRNVSAGSGFGNGGVNGYMGGLRPQSEYIGGLASGVFGKEHQMTDGEFYLGGKGTRLMGS